MLVFLGEVERKVIRQRFSRTAVPGQGIIDIRQRLCTLNRQMHGEQMYPQIPAQALEGHSDPATIWKPYNPESGSRRTIYALMKRSLMVPMMEVLDVCDTTQSSPGRRVTTAGARSILRAAAANPPSSTTCWNTRMD